MLKGKNAIQNVALRFAPAILGQASFTEGAVLDCSKFLKEYGWEFNPPFTQQAAKDKTVAEFSELLNNEENYAFNTKPESFEDLYVLVKRNNEGEIISGAAFQILQIETVCVCYIDAIIVHEDYRKMGIGSQMISLLKECLRSFRGKGKDEIEYLYILLQLSRKSKPHDFFKKQGAKAGFPANFASWKDQYLDQMYVSVKPFSHADNQNSAQDPLSTNKKDSHSTIGAATTIAAGSSKGKSKLADKITAKKAKTTVEEIKAPLTPAKAKKSINQKGEHTQQPKESIPDKSETEPTFSKVTSKSASRAINKHCTHEKCQGKLISGINWGTHLKKQHEGASFTCNKDFFYCGGDDCHLCQDSAEKSSRHGIHNKKKCSQCGDLKRQDKFSKENREVCLVCTKGRSSGSKVNNAEKQEQPQLTQKKLQAFDDQLMKDAQEQENEEEEQANKTASGATNKHCMHEKCQGKFISGADWARRLKTVNEGAVFTCNEDFFYCGGEDCHLFQDIDQNSSKHGVHSKKKCIQYGDFKHKDLFSKETIEVCLSCFKKGSSGSKIGSAEKQQQQSKLTQENLDLLDQHMESEYEDQEQEQQNYDYIDYDKQIQVSGQLQITPLESVSQIGKKRQFSETVDSKRNDSLNRPTKKQKTKAQSSLLQSSTSQTIIVAHTDLNAVEQIRSIETEEKSIAIGAQIIQRLCNIFSQDVLFKYFSRPQPQRTVECIIFTMKRCSNLNDMQVVGLVIASFCIKGQCWLQAIKLINQLGNEHKEIVLRNFELVLTRHFDEDISKLVCYFYRYIDQQQLDIVNYLKENKIKDFTAEILMFSLTVDVQNRPLFVEFAGLFVETAPIAKLILDAIAERPIQTKMSYDNFISLAMLIQEEDYRASVVAITDQLKVSKVINWESLIKQKYESSHIIDGESIQQFIDQYTESYGKIEYLNKELTKVDDNFQMIIDGIVDNAPNRKQFAQAQFAAGMLFREQRQLWVVPSGQGKSRIIATNALIALFFNMFNKVHMVYLNHHLCERDKADSSQMFELFSFEDKVKYHIGCDFEPKTNELIIIDEADAFIFADPQKFRQFISKNACLCYTATPETSQSKGLEGKVIAPMQMKKYFYILEEEGALAIVPDFDQKPTTPVDLVEYIGQLLQKGPVLLYGTEEQMNSLKQSKFRVVHVNDETDAETLRNLDQQENDQYALIVVTDSKWMRGIDYRSKTVKMTLLVAKSFDNYREAIQGFNRVGRFGDNCQRIIFKEVELVDKKEDLKYLKNLLTFSTLMTKDKVSLQQVNVQKLPPPVKPKTEKTKQMASKKEEEKKAVAVTGASNGKRTPIFGQQRANQLLQQVQTQINFRKAEQPIVNNNNENSVEQNQ